MDKNFWKIFIRKIFINAIGLLIMLIGVLVNRNYRNNFEGTDVATFVSKTAQDGTFLIVVGLILLVVGNLYHFICRVIWADEYIKWEEEFIKYISRWKK